MSRGLCSCLSDTDGTAATVRHHARCEGHHPQSMRFGDVSPGEGGARDKAAGEGGAVHHRCSDSWEFPVKIQHTVVFFYFKKGIKTLKIMQYFKQEIIQQIRKSTPILILFMSVFSHVVLDVFS